MSRNKGDGTQRVLITSGEIAGQVARIAREIEGDLAGEESILLVGILKGSVVFMADLIRELSFDAPIDFMSVSSYGSSAESSGVVKILKDLDSDIAGKAVLIVEDIFDTGLTISYLVDLLSTRNPRSIKTAALLVKKGAAQSQIRPDYVGFEIENLFVVGYGLDFDQRYRGLADIAVLEGHDILDR